MKPHTRQHIVPQAYLKRFAQKGDGKRKKPIIYVRNKGQKNTFVKTVDEVAFVKNYYDISFREDEKYWEKHFAERIEPVYGKQFSEIISKINSSKVIKSIVLSTEDKKLLARAISFQLIRTPEFLANQLKKTDEQERQVKSEIISNLGNQLTNRMWIELTRVSMSDEQAKEVILESISNDDRLERFSSILNEKIWLIYVNESSIPFITSDNPVVMKNSISHTIGYRDNGIGRNDTIIFYPLTPTIMVQLIPKTPIFELAFSSTSQINYITRDIKFINLMNKYQELNAFKQVYSKYQFIKKIIK